MKTMYIKIRAVAFKVEFTEYCTPKHRDYLFNEIIGNGFQSIEEEEYLKSGTNPIVTSFSHDGNTVIRLEMRDFVLSCA